MRTPEQILNLGPRPADVDKILEAAGKPIDAYIRACRCQSADEIKEALLTLAALATTIASAPPAIFNSAMYVVQPMKKGPEGP